MTQKLKEWASKHPEVQFMTLFGSFSDGRSRADSDADVGILCAGGPLSEDQRVNLNLDLASHLNREVDVVDLTQAHGLILKEALTRSVQILNRNPSAVARLLNRFYFEEADYAPLKNRALAERRQRVFKTQH